MIYVVPRQDAGSRLDRFLANAASASREEAGGGEAAASRASRAELQRWIEAGRVTVNGVVKGASTKLREGDRVEAQPLDRAPSAAKPDAAVAVDVVYLDDDVVVVEKPAGLVVHPAAGHEGGTLVNGLLALGLFSRLVVEGEVEGARARAREEDGDAEHDRPGIVHRLDKGTSGVMVVARTVEAREALKAQFQAHTIAREYEAIVVGAAREATHATLHGRHPHDRMRFTSRVKSGKRAVTHVHVLAALRGATHVACHLETGRTHQIRVHLSESGTPVLGDPVYGKPPKDPVVRAAGEALGHQALHARMLGFVHPRTGARMHFEVEAPPDFAEALARLSG